MTGFFFFCRHKNTLGIINKYPFETAVHPQGVVDSQVLGITKFCYEQFVLDEAEADRPCPPTKPEPSLSTQPPR